MPLYLGRFSYTADAIRGLVANPQDRAASAAELFESLGAKLIGFWYAFGEFDGVFLAEAPDNATAMAAGNSRRPFCSICMRHNRPCVRRPPQPTGPRVRGRHPGCRPRESTEPARAR